VSNPPEPRLQSRQRSKDDPRVSVIISTFNRAGALAETLSQLDRQTLDPSDYEVVVTDDGSTDDTAAVLANADTRYQLRTIRFEHNRGVSAGRNAAIQASRGSLLVLVSDDVLVPEGFLAAHLAAHERWSNAWIVGRFEQLDNLRGSPFGRYLEGLERDFDRQRKGEQLDIGVWRMPFPTARNLSIPREHLERIGLFDERFRTTCEDQDLAHRAEPLGASFLYDESITCIHNDQASNLERYGSFSERGAADGVLFCRKWAPVHGSAEIVRANDPIRLRDGLPLIIKKALKRLLAHPQPMHALHWLAGVAERAGASDRTLARLYQITIGVHMQRGWTRGRKALRGAAQR
jgi:GT2 family glycosyltransferase